MGLRISDGKQHGRRTRLDILSGAAYRFLAGNDRAYVVPRLTQLTS